jgi:hypothetical protein
MEPLGQHAFMGPVDLDLISVRANPPAIYSLAKHALDDARRRAVTGCRHCGRWS